MTVEFWFRDFYTLDIEVIHRFEKVVNKQVHRTTCVTTQKTSVRHDVTQTTSIRPATSRYGKRSAM